MKRDRDPENHDINVHLAARAAAGYCNRNASAYGDARTLIEDVERDARYVLDTCTDDEMNGAVAPLVYARAFDAPSDTDPPKQTPKPPKMPLRRLRREMERERAQLVERVERHIKGIWPIDHDPETQQWVELNTLWHGPKYVSFTCGMLIAFDEKRQPVIQINKEYRPTAWADLPLEDLWEILPTIRKMRGLAKGARVTDPFEKRETPSPRYYYWARRAAAGFVPNKRYWPNSYYTRSEILGVTDKERAVLDEMFKKNKERL